MQDEYLTVCQVATLKSVSRNAVYKAVHDGRLAATQLVGRVAIRRTDAQNWIPRERTGRRKGVPTSEAAKAKIAESQRLRWKRRKEGEI